MRNINSFLSFLSFLFYVLQLISNMPEHVETRDTFKARLKVRKYDMTIRLLMKRLVYRIPQNVSSTSLTIDIRHILIFRFIHVFLSFTRGPSRSYRRDIIATERR